MEPHETKKLCKAKDIAICTKQLFIKRGKDFTNCPCNRGLVSKIDKEMKKLNIKKTYTPILKKWGTDLNIEFSKEETQMTEKH